MNRTNFNCIIVIVNQSLACRIALSIVEGRTGAHATYSILGRQVVKDYVVYSGYGTIRMRSFMVNRC